MANPETLYKLMVLYMLKKVNFPLSNPQVYTFFEENKYTNFFTYQTMVAELVSSNLISEETVRTGKLYEITKEGEQALFYFQNDIAQEIRDEMDAYIDTNKFQLRNETGVTTDYYKTDSNDYKVHMRVREGKTVTFELTISVPSEEQALEVCEHFEKNADRVYGALIKQLL